MAGTGDTRQRARRITLGGRVAEAVAPMGEREVGDRRRVPLLVKRAKFSVLRERVPVRLLNGKIEKRGRGQQDKRGAGTKLRKTMYRWSQETQMN